MLDLDDPAVRANWAHVAGYTGNENKGVVGDGAELGMAASQAGGSSKELK